MTSFEVTDTKTHQAFGDEGLRHRVGLDTRLPLQRVVVITRLTRLEELVLRHITRDQVRFYLSHLGEDYAAYEEEHEQYRQAVAAVRRAIDPAIRLQLLERTLLPTYQFGPTDLAITVGPKGIVANAAKYLNGQPLLALQPNPGSRFFPLKTLLDTAPTILGRRTLANLVTSALNRTWQPRHFTMAQAILNDGQRLLALNDLFLGQSGHAAAKYALTWNGRTEKQCSSGLIVSTGTGSTGWLSSLARGAVGLHNQLPGLAHAAPDSAIAETPPLGESADAQPNKRRVPPGQDYGAAVRFAPDAPYLVWAVREPFVEPGTQASLLGGTLGHGPGPALQSAGGLPLELDVLSHMPQHGVIFSDGMEGDFLEFPAGTRARIEVAPDTLAALTLN